MIPRDATIARCLQEATDMEAAIFVGNGNNARATAALGDGQHIFYMLGSMGLCPSIAAGYAGATGGPTLVMEGDGNALMGANMLSAVARYAAPRFAHVVLDNGLYETTGGQRTLANIVDFPSLALASSYSESTAVETLDRLAAAVRTALGGGGPTLIRVLTAPVEESQHPRVPLTPPQIRARFEGGGHEAAATMTR